MEAVTYGQPNNFSCGFQPGLTPPPQQKLNHIVMDLSVDNRRQHSFHFVANLTGQSPL